MKFTFPDKTVVYAETNDGFWVMQYSTRIDYESDDKKPIVVELRSPRSSGGGGSFSRFPLRWGDDTCDQVNHGC